MKLVISLAILIITLGIVQVLSLPELEIVKTYDAIAEVGKPTGIAINSTAFDFGRVIPNGLASKKLNLRNDQEKPLFVKIIATGNISEGLEINQNNFYLQPEEQKEVFIAFRGQGLQNGHYRGQIIITMYS